MKNRKDFDEDSRIRSKGIASQGRWKPGASRPYLNITSELQTPKDGKSSVRVGADGDFLRYRKLI